RRRRHLLELGRGLGYGTGVDGKTEVGNSHGIAPEKRKAVASPPFDGREACSNGGLLVLRRGWSWPRRSRRATKRRNGRRKRPRYIWLWRRHAIGSWMTRRYSRRRRLILWKPWRRAAIPLT